MSRERVFTRPFAFLCGSSFAVFLSIGMLIPVLPVFAKDSLGLGGAGIGLAVAASAPTAALLQPVIGRLADLRGRRTFLVLGPALYCAAGLGLLLVGSLPALVAVRLVAGLAEAGMFVINATVAADLAHPSRRGEALSLFSVANWGGLAVGPPIGELLLGDNRFGTVWLASALAAFAGALLARAVPETRPAREAGHPHGALLSRAGLLPGLTIFTGLIGFAAISAFAPLYARHIGMSGAGWVLALNGAIVLVTRVAARQVPDRLGALRAASVSVVGIAAGLVVIAATGTPLGLYLGTAVLALGQSLAFPSLMLLVMQAAAPTERSAAVGSFSALAEIGFAVGAVGLGAVQATAGYGWLFATAAAAVMLGLVPLASLRLSRP